MDEEKQNLSAGTTIDGASEAYSFLKFPRKFWFGCDRYSCWLQMDVRNVSHFTETEWDNDGI